MSEIGRDVGRCLESMSTKSPRSDKSPISASLMSAIYPRDHILSQGFKSQVLVSMSQSLLNLFLEVQDFYIDPASKCDCSTCQGVLALCDFCMKPTLNS